PVGRAPRGIARANDGRLWVTLRDESALVAVDPEALSIEAELELARGARPHDILFSPHDGRGYVSLEGAGAVVEFDPDTLEITQSLAVGSTPRGLALTADGARLLVSRFISPPAPGESTLSVDTATAHGEVRFIDLPGLDSARVVPLRFSERVDGSVQGRGIVNYLGAPAPSPDGKTVWIPSKQDNISRGTLRDGMPLDFQNTVRAVASRIDLQTESEIVEGRVDLDNSGLARAVAVHPSGAYAFVALETSREVAVLNAILGTELFRIDVGRAPQALVLSADGRRLYVENFMDRSVSVVDLTPLVRHGQFDADVVATLDATATETLPVEVFLGKQLFYDASDPRLARDAYLSCATCHAEGGQDGRVWDLSGQGEGLRNTISLQGMKDRVGLLHWSGNFDEVQDFEGQIRGLAAGTGLLADAVYEAGSLREPLGDPKTGSSVELDALAAYVDSLAEVPESPEREGDELSELGGEGRQAFLRLGCNGCHYGATFADEERSMLHDIGTLKAASGQRLFGPLEGIDVPSLRGVFSTGPYLHDGSAATLEAAIEAHHVAGVDPDALALELGPLVAFLQQLDGRQPPVARLGCFDTAQNGDETGVDCGGSCDACEGDPPDGAGGATSSSVGGATSSSVGGATSASVGGATSASVGGTASTDGATSASVGGTTSSSVGGTSSSSVGGATSASVGGTASSVGGATSSSVGGAASASVGGAASSVGGAASSVGGAASSTGGTGGTRGAATSSTGGTEGAGAAATSSTGGGSSEAGAAGEGGDGAEAGSAGEGGQPAEGSHGGAQPDAGCGCRVVGGGSSGRALWFAAVAAGSVLVRRRRSSRRGR
ncbi:MAG TPA: cytochrome c peroxidase, partial [Polyangiaceae bacterium]